MSPDLAFALSLADDADAITLPRFRAHDLRVETKPDLTPVSEADRAVEAALRERLARERPGEAVLGEEEGGEDASGWILDPIDGTRNYTRGIPVWATLIAYADRVAVVSAPALGRRWWAERGAGAFRDGSAIHVSAIDRLEDATVLYGLERPPPARAYDALAHPRLRRLLGAHARRRGRGRGRRRRVRARDLGLGADEDPRRGGRRPLRGVRLLERAARRQRAALTAAS